MHASRSEAKGHSFFFFTWILSFKELYRYRMFILKKERTETEKEQKRLCERKKEPKYNEIRSVCRCECCNRFATQMTMNKHECANIILSILWNYNIFMTSKKEIHLPLHSIS